jgi:hypothetical protein
LRDRPSPPFAYSSPIDNFDRKENSQPKRCAMTLCRATCTRAIRLAIIAVLGVTNSDTAG